MPWIPSKLSRGSFGRKICSSTKQLMRRLQRQPLASEKNSKSILLDWCGGVICELRPETTELAKDLNQSGFASLADVDVTTGQGALMRWKSIRATVCCVDASPSKKHPRQGVGSVEFVMGKGSGALRILRWNWPLKFYKR